MCVCVSCSALSPEHRRGVPKEEFFITDVAYCEQAVIFLKQAKLPHNNSQRRKEDGTLPVRTQTLYLLLLMVLRHCYFKMLLQTRSFVNVPVPDSHIGHKRETEAGVKVYIKEDLIRMTWFCGQAEDKHEEEQNLVTVWFVHQGGI